MTLFNSAQTDFFVDDDAISAFTDDTGEATIIADATTAAGTRLFALHIVTSLRSADELVS